MVYLNELCYTYNDYNSITYITLSFELFQKSTWTKNSCHTWGGNVIGICDKVHEMATPNLPQYWFYKEIISNKISFVNKFWMKVQ